MAQRRHPLDVRPLAAAGEIDLGTAVFHVKRPTEFFWRTSSRGADGSIFGGPRLDSFAQHGLAEDPFQPLCSARPPEVNPVLWANLLDAEKGGWRAILHCHRRLENLKRTKSCPETVELPVLVLKALFGWDYELEKLPRRFRCPHCGSQTIEIE